LKEIITEGVLKLFVSLLHSLWNITVAYEFFEIECSNVNKGGCNQTYVSQIKQVL